MEELVRQLVAALEEMRNISRADQEGLGEWGATPEGPSSLRDYSPEGQGPFLSDSQELMRRVREVARTSRARRLANNHALRLELSVFRMLRDLSRDEALLRGADRVWDLMEERWAIGILDPEDDVVLPDAPHDDVQAAEYVQSVRKAMRESRDRQMGSFDAILARQDELLSQALAEARAMLS